MKVSGRAWSRRDSPVVGASRKSDVAVQVEVEVGGVFRRHGGGLGRCPLL